MLRPPPSLLPLLFLSFAVGCDSEPPPAPLLEIPVVDVIVRDTPIILEMVGQTRGSIDVPIRARVEGTLDGMHFVEGRRVEKDALLYEIDPRPFEAKVVEASGYLAAARTRLAKARADLARLRPLAEMKAISQMDFDGAVARHDAARGEADAAEAQVEQARIELSYTRIHSPIDGRIGISAAKVGEFVGAAPNPVVLNFVSQTDPIRVRFAIDERKYLRFARREITLQRAGDVRDDPDGLELILADGSLHPARGYIVAADAAIDPGTGTFTLEADFANPDGLVLAGQFARVRAVVGLVKAAVLVPQRCITELQGNFRVFVVAEDGTVELRPVERGPRIGSLQILESGVEPGERVALEGVMRLQQGMKVSAQLVEFPATPVGAESDAEAAAGS
ncbi:MAG: efflux RND transporter periplasmic adaptor subunit [Deltaproteobacteria bacterium]|nr:efflux RND transporter periplasmic adaptor subunit [Deltaproteobacteria bacterium]